MDFGPPFCGCGAHASVDAGFVDYGAVEYVAAEGEVEVVCWVVGEAERFHFWETVDGCEDFGDGRWRSTGKDWGEGVVYLALWELGFCSHCS